MAGQRTEGMRRMTRRLTAAQTAEMYQRGEKQEAIKEVAALRQLAQARIDVGQMREGVKLWEGLLKKARVAYGSDTLEYAELCGQVGDACYAAGSYQAAQRYCDEMRMVMSLVVSETTRDTDMQSHIMGKARSYENLFAMRFARDSVAAGLALLVVAQAQCAAEWQVDWINLRQVHVRLTPADTVVQVPLPEVSSGAQMSFHFSPDEIRVSCAGIVLVRGPPPRCLDRERLRYVGRGIVNYSAAGRMLFLSFPAAAAVRTRGWVCGESVGEGSTTSSSSFSAAAAAAAPDTVELTALFPEMQRLEEFVVQLTPFCARVALAADRRQGDLGQVSTFYFKRPVNPDTLVGTFDGGRLCLHAEALSSASEGDAGLTGGSSSSSGPWEILHRRLGEMLVETYEPLLPPTSAPLLVVYCGVRTSALRGLCAAALVAAAAAAPSSGDGGGDGGRYRPGVESPYSPVSGACAASLALLAAAAAAAAAPVRAAQEAAAAAALVAVVEAAAAALECARMLSRVAAAFHARTAFVRMCSRRRRTGDAAAAAGVAVALLALAPPVLAAVDTLRSTARGAAARADLRARHASREAQGGLLTASVVAALAAAAAASHAPREAARALARVVRGARARAALAEERAARRRRAAAAACAAASCVLLSLAAPVLARIELLESVCRGYAARRSLAAARDARRLVAAVRAVAHADAVRAEGEERLRGLRGRPPHTRGDAAAQAAQAEALAARSGAAEDDAAAASGLLAGRSRSLARLRRARSAALDDDEEAAARRAVAERRRFAPPLARVGRGALARAALRALHARVRATPAAAAGAAAAVVVLAAREEAGVRLLQRVGRGGARRAVLALGVGDRVAEYRRRKERRARLAQFGRTLERQRGALAAQDEAYRRAAPTAAQQGAARVLQARWRGRAGRRAAAGRAEAAARKGALASRVQAAARVVPARREAALRAARAAAAREAARRAAEEEAARTTVVRAAARGFLAARAAAARAEAEEEGLAARLVALRRRRTEWGSAQQLAELREGERVGRAVALMQRVERGRQARRRVRVLRGGGTDYAALARVEEEAALLVQAVCRGRLARRRVARCRPALVAEREARVAARDGLRRRVAAALQAVGRGAVARAQAAAAVRGRLRAAGALQRVGRGRGRRRRLARRLAAVRAEEERVKAAVAAALGRGAGTLQRAARRFAARRARAQHEAAKARRKAGEEEEARAQEEAFAGAAARAIQAAYRGWSVSRLWSWQQLQRAARRRDAAVHIQRVVRGHLARRFVRRLRPVVGGERQERELVAFRRTEAAAKIHGFFKLTAELLCGLLDERRGAARSEEGQRLLLEEAAAREATRHRADAGLRWLFATGHVPIAFARVLEERAAELAYLAQVEGAERGGVAQRVFARGAAACTRREGDARETVAEHEAAEFSALSAAASADAAVAAAAARERRAGEKAAVQTAECRGRLRVQRAAAAALEAEGIAWYAATLDVLRRRRLLEREYEPAMRLSDEALERDGRLDLKRDFLERRRDVQGSEREGLVDEEAVAREEFEEEWEARLYALGDKEASARTATAQRDRASAEVLLGVEETLQLNKIAREEAAARHALARAREDGVAAHRSFERLLDFVRRREAAGRNDVCGAEACCRTDVRDEYQRSGGGGGGRRRSAFDVATSRLAQRAAEARRAAEGEEAVARLAHTTAERTARADASAAAAARAALELAERVRPAHEAEAAARAAVAVGEEEGRAGVVEAGEGTARGAAADEEQRARRPLCVLWAAVVGAVPAEAAARAGVGLLEVAAAAALVRAWEASWEAAGRRTMVSVGFSLLPGQEQGRAEAVAEERAGRDAILLQSLREEGPVAEADFRARVRGVATKRLDGGAEARRRLEAAAAARIEESEMPTLAALARVPAVRMRGRLGRPSHDAALAEHSEGTARARLAAAEEAARERVRAAAWEELPPPPPALEAAAATGVAEREAEGRGGVEEGEAAAAAAMAGLRVDAGQVRARQRAAEREEVRGEEARDRQVVAFEEEAVWDDFAAVAGRRLAVLAGKRLGTLVEDVCCDGSSGFGGSAGAGSGFAASLLSPSRPSIAALSRRPTTGGRLSLSLTDFEGVAADPPLPFAPGGGGAGVSAWWEKVVTQRFRRPPMHGVAIFKDLSRRECDQRAGVVRSALLPAWRPRGVPTGERCPGECRVGADAFAQVLALYRECFRVARCPQDGCSADVAWTGAEALTEEGVVAAVGKLTAALSNQELCLFVARLRLVVAAFVQMTEGASPSLRALWNFHAQAQSPEGFVASAELHAACRAYLLGLDAPPLFVSVRWSADSAVCGESLVERLDGMLAQAWSPLGKTGDEVSAEAASSAPEVQLSYVGVAEFLTVLLLPV